MMSAGRYIVFLVAHAINFFHLQFDYIKGGMITLLKARSARKFSVTFLPMSNAWTSVRVLRSYVDYARIIIHSWQIVPDIVSSG